MSIIANNIKLNIDQDDALAFDFVRKCYGNNTRNFRVYKKSIDARRGDIKKVISVVFDADDEMMLLDKNSCLKQKVEAVDFVPSANFKFAHKPVVVGFGPAGILASYELAKHGFAPIVFERGADIDTRDFDVADFMKHGNFNVNSNIQFGEGGAGSYSDGKLTTRISDPNCEYILKLLVKFGAPNDILYTAKPHVGTDILKTVVKNIRLEIIRLGGEIHFNCKITDFGIKNGRIISVFADEQEIFADKVILSIGHSARDTFEKILERNIFIEPKAFAIGARVEHHQTDIDRALYGKYCQNPNLPVGEYNLAHTKNERGCYSFCMCPGGVVVPSNSTENAVVVNGMSYHARDGINANSAVVVSVRPSDFDGNDALCGVRFQEKIERLAFAKAGSNYYAPTQTVSDFVSGRVSSKFGKVKPSYEIGTSFCDLNEILPRFVCDSMKDGLAVFAKKNSAFADGDSVLTGPETRTSSPIRITRNENFESVNVIGLVPCGEGAGYAGGIISAMADGLKCARKLMTKEI